MYLAFQSSIMRCSTLLGVQSWVRFCQQEFGEFPRLVGRYCSYQLPKQTRGTPQFLVVKTSFMTGRLRVSLGMTVLLIWAPIGISIYKSKFQSANWDPKLDCWTLSRRIGSRNLFDFHIHCRRLQDPRLPRLPILPRDSSLNAPFQFPQFPLKIQIFVVTPSSKITASKRLIGGSLTGLSDLPAVVLYIPWCKPIIKSF